MSDLQNLETVAKFKIIYKRQMLVSIPAVLAVIVTLYLMQSGTVPLLDRYQNYVFIGIFAVIAAVLVFSLKNWRCPGCDRYLGKGFSPKFCTKCGAQLK